GNGLSWPTAFRFLQDALAAAQPSDEIRVAQGTYYPDRDAAHPTGTADRALSFTLKDGVGLYGSYAGLGATDPNARDIAAYVTVLSGDIGAPGDDSDNSYHVVHGGSTSASALLDGFTITDGNANGAAPHDRGGGVHCDDSSSPTLANCTIAGNTASLNGGGVYCGYFSRPTLTNCDIVNNVADHGGGLHFYDSSSPTLADCTIAGNLAADGGGVYCDHSDYHAIPTLTNCTIAQNTAAGSGGGVYGDGYAILVLTACTIIGNTAGGDGAGVHGGWYSSLTLTSCSITDNAAGTDGGGVYCGSYADATLTACTITDNMASERGAGVCCHCFSAKLTSCALKSNVAGGNGGGVYCDASSLTLVNSTLADNVGGNGGGVYCEANPTARLTNCTFTGNAAASKGGGLYRSAISNPIFTNCILWANTPQAIYPQGGSMVVTYCDVQGGWSGTGNIDADPEFAFPDDPHLLNSSPCIDAGTNSPSGGLPSSDADGLARVLDGDGDGSTVADMGACEFDPATPTLALSATRLTITALTGQTGSRALEIRNSTCGALAWELHCAADWLTADPVAGESAGEVDTVTLTASTTDLTHGTYVTTAWVNAAQALNAPRAVTVVLRVAGTLHVPSEYPTIQAAIDAATFPGDEVVIADGVYAGPGNINLDFRGRAIPLRSVSGDPALCTIDCEGNGCGCYFHSGEGPASNVQGLTIRNASNS
ncbi:MAG TPA: right-handed parallel beta-helix repeat-containing protein, partial [Phycisphaerae bacterium]|nr:right-handed parallel beta-helix repeat-containing protein [Phycisphaerae bacterium]